MFFNIFVVFALAMFVAGCEHAEDTHSNVQPSNIELVKKNTSILCTSIIMRGQFVNTKGRSTDTDNFLFCGNGFQIKENLIVTVEHVVPTVERGIYLAYSKKLKRLEKNAHADIGNWPVRIDQIEYSGHMTSAEGMRYLGVKKVYTGSWHGTFTQSNLERFIESIRELAVVLESANVTEPKRATFTVLKRDEVADLAVIGLSVPLSRKWYIKVEDIHPEFSTRVWGVAMFDQGFGEPFRTIITKGFVLGPDLPLGYYAIRTETPTRGGSSGSATFDDEGRLIGVTAQAITSEHSWRYGDPNPCSWVRTCQRWVARPDQVLALLRSIEQ